MRLSGLRSNLRPTIFNDDPVYCKHFENILNKCWFDIILLTIDTLQKKLTESREKIQSVEQQIFATTALEDWTATKEKIDKIIQDFRITNESKKRQKFLRDTDDYALDRVYRWQDNRPNRFYSNSQCSNQRYHTSSSDSDNSTSSQRGRFLGRRRYERPYNYRQTRFPRGA